MQDVMHAHTQWFDALLDEDAEVLDVLLADDMTFHAPGGTAETKALFLEHLRTGRLEYDSIKAETPLIRLHDRTAIVTGKVDILYRWEDQPNLERLYYTAVYGWISPQWRMLAWQSTNRQEVTNT